MILWICIVSAMSIVFCIENVCNCICDIYVHVLVLALVHVAGIPGTTLKRTYPIGTGFVPSGFRGSSAAR